jgi:hypothetical protein
MYGDRDAADLIEHELQRGERLLWQGAPDSGRWFQPQDAILLPFSLLWGGFAIFWEVSVLSSGSARSSVIAPLWGIPFICVGLYLIFGRVLVRRWLLAHTAYALTDRRAITIARALSGGNRVSSVWFGSYPQVDKRVARNGRGTVWIGTFPSWARTMITDPGWPGLGRGTGNAMVFMEIEDPERVYSLISERLSKQASGGSAL